MIRALFFDVSGTLYDETHPRIKAEAQVFQQVAEAAAKPFDKVFTTYQVAKSAVIHQTDGKYETNDRVSWYEEMLHHFPGTGLSPKDLAARYWQILMDTMEPYYDASYALPELAKTYRLYVITDELGETEKAKLEKLGMLHLFADVISADQVGESKPDKKIFQSALERAGVSAAQALMVGDNPGKDIWGAQKVGMKTCWLRRGKYYHFRRWEDEAVPDRIITNFGVMVGHIANL